MIEGLHVLVISRAKQSGVPNPVGPPMAVRSKMKEQTEGEQTLKISTAELGKDLHDFNSQTRGREQHLSVWRNQGELWQTQQLDATKFVRFRLSQSLLNREEGVSVFLMCGLLRCAELSTKIKFTPVILSSIHNHLRRHHQGR